jgi:hypothetical protein
MIDKLRDTRPVANLCGLVKVTKSGYQSSSRGTVIPAKKPDDQCLLAANFIAAPWKVFPSISVWASVSSPAAADQGCRCCAG